MYPVNQGTHDRLNQIRLFFPVFVPSLSTIEGITNHIHACIVIYIVYNKRTGMYMDLNAYVIIHFEYRSNSRFYIFD